jgi:hypothetical protein
VYSTPDTSTQVVIGGQATDYYEINDFLLTIASELVGHGVLTKTMLVASQHHPRSTTIDFDRARERILAREFQNRFPGAIRLQFGERGKLESMFDACEKLRGEDTMNILGTFLEAKARRLSEGVPKLGTFFGAYEECLRAGLPRILREVYGDDWEGEFDELKRSEGIEQKRKVKDLVLGHLCKVYKRLALTKDIIDIQPLSTDEFSQVMDEAVEWRNAFAHTNGVETRRFDELFEFCCRFIPIHHRLTTYVEDMTGGRARS